MRKKLMARTHEDICSKKRLFMRLLRGNLDKEQIREYENAVNCCDRMTARIVEKAKRLCAILLLSGLLLSLSGCLENTMTGLGRFIDGGGQFVSGVGKDVIRGSEGYSKR